MTVKHWFKFIVAIVVCNLAGVVGSFFTTPAIDGWYATLLKPSFSPPNWVFAPVWTTLFTLMGVALFLVIKKKPFTSVIPAILLFGLQLLANIAWSFLFFGLHSPLLGLVDILVLLILIVCTIVAFYKISKVAAYLLIPYVVWVSFATILNFYLWRLNLNS